MGEGDGRRRVDGEGVGLSTADRTERGFVAGTMTVGALFSRERVEGTRTRISLPCVLEDASGVCSEPAASPFARPFVRPSASLSHTGTAFRVTLSFRPTLTPETLPLGLNVLAGVLAPFGLITGVTGLSILPSPSRSSSIDPRAGLSGGEIGSDGGGRGGRGAYTTAPPGVVRLVLASAALGESSEGIVPVLIDFVKELGGIGGRGCWSSRIRCLSCSTDCPRVSRRIIPARRPPFALPVLPLGAPSDRPRLGGSGVESGVSGGPCSRKSMRSRVERETGVRG
jgi:hypothetical protein